MKIKNINILYYTIKDISYNNTVNNQLLIIDY